MRIRTRRCDSKAQEASKVGKLFKSIVTVLILILVILPSAGNYAKEGKTEILRQIIEALGAAGDSIAKLTDGFEHLIIAGARGYDNASARITLSRLRDISADTSDLLITQNILVLDSIEEYLREPSPERWPSVTERLGEVLTKVTDLLTDVREERSDFVLEIAYEKMLGALSARQSLLQQLINTEPPQSEEELSLLSEIHQEYQRLMANLRQAKSRLNEYIKAEKSR